MCSATSPHVGRLREGGLASMARTNASQPSDTSKLCAPVMPQAMAHIAACAGSSTPLQCNQEKSRGRPHEPL